jgi:hypothetical protein
MTTSGSMSDRARRGYGRVEQFVREYTAGMNAAEVRRLFQNDAAEAYAVLTRDQPEEPRSAEDRLRRFLVGVRVFFLGLSYKLTPARRLLFAAALAFALLGFWPNQLTIRPGQEIVLDFSPVWFVLSIASLVFLLALELVDRVRVRDELEIARKLQRDLLPQGGLELPGYRLAHSYRTANEVGGDYYRFPHLPDGRVALMIGDASGHGMAAGLLMAIADATIRTALDLDPAPPRVADLLNRALCRTGGRRAFMTFFYATLEPATGRLDYVCAGHPFPLLRRVGGALEELGCGSLPLGLRDELAPSLGSAVLEPGDLLLLYTDGIAEARSAEGKDFGFERLRRLAAAGGAAETLHNGVLYELDRHRGDTPLSDDVTLVVLERLPPLPAA